MTSRKSENAANLVILINPISGAGKADHLYREMSQNRNILDKIANTLGVESVQLKKIYTTQDGLWKAALLDYVRRFQPKCLIAMGGDGTLKEAACFLYENKFKDISLMPVPAGRGNDFVRASLGWEPSLDGFWSWFLQSKSWTSSYADLAQANGQKFLNMASLGYGGAVVEKTLSRNAFWSKSPLVYQVEGAISLFQESEVPVQVRVPEESDIYKGPFFGAFIGNGQSNGSGLYWTPEASIHDGLLDSILFPKPSSIRMIQSLARVKEKKMPSFDYRRLTARKITFVFNAPVPIELDGDYAGRSHQYEIICLPQAIKILLPKI